MKKSGKNYKGIIFDLDGTLIDTLEDLADSVNEMSEHLEVMVSQIKEDERKMRHAELRLLQEQINPHFLYNTLDTIIWLIEGNLSEQAVDMVVSLSDFFRLVLSHGKEFISIRDEELHILSYLKIQQVRYHDILDYEISIAPELYPYRILKLTLQPLVENAIYHGVKLKRGEGHLSVRVAKEGEKNIRLQVKDDGRGMGKERAEDLEKLLNEPSKPEQNRSFGLFYVKERLRIRYGDNYQVKVHSIENEGTTVVIFIPVKEQ